MHILLVIGILLLLSIMMMFTYAACKLGADYDRQMDEWFVNHYTDHPNDGNGVNA